MRRHTLAALLIGAALVLSAPLSAAAPGAPPPDPCAVKATSRPTITPGIYHVTLTVSKPCVQVQVRLESYVGGTFPRNGWFTLTPSRPLTRDGVPWYWRASVRSASGTTSYPLIIPGMVNPFSPRPQ
ncbi:hypothetical protein [Deinococcus multiflagellatus]|uniref:Secreted protein n=1 Tax=Deinococcus multiflagellatus TaxID=1656887 RepID=A0ABW1ZH67_9DEIO|nr:hypothetical protein [Deinococcus multiflagellatus]MBZ9713737.1 hypothetical protein [Deinococcus multiflagellatus]